MRSPTLLTEIVGESERRAAPAGGARPRTEARGRAAAAALWLADAVAVAPAAASGPTFRPRGKNRRLLDRPVLLWYKAERSLWDEVPVVS